MVNSLWCVRLRASINPIPAYTEAEADSIAEALNAVTPLVRAVRAEWPNLPEDHAKALVARQIEERDAARAQEACNG